MLVVGVLLAVFILTPASAYAISVSPGSPVAGQPITFTGNEEENFNIYTGSGCSHPLMFISAGIGSFSCVLTGGLSAGSYSAKTDSDVTCTNFTVTTATTTGTPHTIGIYVGAAYLAHKNCCAASPTDC